MFAVVFFASGSEVIVALLASSTDGSGYDPFRRCALGHRLHQPAKLVRIFEHFHALPLSANPQHKRGHYEPEQGNHTQKSNALHSSESRPS